MSWQQTRYKVPQEREAGELLNVNMYLDCWEEKEKIKKNRKKDIIVLDSFLVIIQPTESERASSEANEWRRRWRVSGKSMGHGPHWRHCPNCLEKIGIPAPRCAVADRWKVPLFQPCQMIGQTSFPWVTGRYSPGHTPPKTMGLDLPKALSAYRVCPHKSLWMSLPLDSGRGGCIPMCHIKGKAMHPQLQEGSAFQTERQLSAGAGSN